MIDFKGKELITIGKAYDISETSLIVLEKNLNIKYINDYAKKLFNIDNAAIYIGKSLNDLAKQNKLPPLVDKKLNVLKKPISMGTISKQLHLKPALVEGEKGFFLFDTDVTELENIHCALESKLTQITGNPPLNRESGQYSIDTLCNCFESIISQMPGYIYWKDQNFKYVFCNNAVAHSLGFKNPEEIRGKTDYDFGWDKKLVDKYRKLDTEIMNTGASRLNVEESIVEHDGHTLNLLVNKMPLFDQNKGVIGIIGVDIDITDSKEREKLRIKLEKHEAIEAKNKSFKDFTTELVGVINKFQIANDSGREHNDLNINIELTKREKEVLYFLARGKKPKDIAFKLGIAPKTAQSIVDGKLFHKFNVHNIGDLIEKAQLLNLIPFTL